jgi:hypothetical protein
VTDSLRRTAGRDGPRDGPPGDSEPTRARSLPVWEMPPPPRPRWRSWRSWRSWRNPIGRLDLTAGAVCVLAMVVAGGFLGVLWAATAPRIDIAEVTRGSEAVYNAQAGVDAYFGMIAAVSGLVGGIVAFWRGRDAGWPVPVGLALGGWLGSLLGGWVGHALRSHRVLDQLPAGAGALVTELVDFRVRSSGLYLVAPCVALFVLATMVWVSTLGRPRGDSRSADGGPAGGEPGAAAGSPSWPGDGDRNRDVADGARGDGAGAGAGGLIPPPDFSSGSERS